MADLDLAALKRLPFLQTVVWKTVDAWVELGVELNRGEDLQCTAFRKLACRKLLESRAGCAKYFQCDHTTKDTTRKNFKKAVKEAQASGLIVGNEDSLDRVQRWAVALLDPQTQFTEEVMRALLDVELGNQMGILVSQCIQSREEEQSCPKLHTFMPFQPMVPAGAKFLIAVVHVCKQQHLEDHEIDAFVSRTRQRNRTSQNEDYTRYVLAQNRRRFARAQFMDAYRKHHFEQAAIRNGYGGALIVNQLRSQGANAAPANDAEKAASLEKYDKWLTNGVAVYKNAMHNTTLLPDDALFMRREFARHFARGQAGKARPDGDSTDEDNDGDSTNEDNNGKTPTEGGGCTVVDFSIEADGASSQRLQIEKRRSLDFAADPAGLDPAKDPAPCRSADMHLPRIRGQLIYFDLALKWPRIADADSFQRRACAADCQGGGIEDAPHGADSTSTSRYQLSAASGSTQTVTKQQLEHVVTLMSQCPHSNEVDKILAFNARLDSRLELGPAITTHIDVKKAMSKHRSKIEQEEGFCERLLKRILQYVCNSVTVAACNVDPAFQAELIGWIQESLIPRLRERLPACYLFDLEAAIDMPCTTDGRLLQTRNQLLYDAQHAPATGASVPAATAFNFGSFKYMRNCCDKCAAPCDPSKMQGFVCRCGACCCHDCCGLTREQCRQVANEFECDSCRELHCSTVAQCQRRNLKACFSCRVPLPKTDPTIIQSKCPMCCGLFCQRCACIAICELPTGRIPILLPCATCVGQETYEKDREAIVIRFSKLLWAMATRIQQAHQIEVAIVQGFD